MSILQLLEQKHISELERVTKELYSFHPPKADFITTIIEGSVASKTRGTFITGAGVTSVGIPTLPALIGSIFGAFAQKKEEPNMEKIRKNIQEIEEERETYFQVDSYIDNSISKIANTDAFNVLSGVVASNVETEIGSINWRKLEEKSKLFITTAEVLREFLQVFNDNLDYSPPTLNYCKAVENELNEKLLFPFKKYYESKQIKLRNSDYESKLFFVITNDDLKLTLGEHVFILRRIVNNKQLTNIELEYKRFIMISNPSSLGRLNQRINIITKYYRNPSGHTEVMDQKKCLECRNYILTQDGVLPGILGNFKIIK
jgi:hypothetical protein